jgi:hypothetical protein
VTVGAAIGGGSERIAGGARGGKWLVWCESGGGAFAALL